MTLSAGEQDVLNEIADRVAADDPGYSGRLGAFGGYDVSPLGPPSRWTALPVLIVAVILAIGAVAAIVSSADDSVPQSQSQSVSPSR